MVALRVNEETTSDGQGYPKCLIAILSLRSKIQLGIWFVFLLGPLGPSARITLEYGNVHLNTNLQLEGGAH